MNRKEFEKWFREKHGKKPRGNRKSLIDRIVDGEKARVEYHELLKYEARYTTARYMFNMFTDKGAS